MTRPTFTVSAAAEATGKSRRTIGRLLDDDLLPGAYRDESGAWCIPTEGLLAAGLALHAPSPPDVAPAAAIAAAVDPVDALRAELADMRRRAEVAEAIAIERGAALDDVRAALALAQRMLTAGDVPPAVEPEHVQSAPGRRARWWRNR